MIDAPELEEIKRKIIRGNLKQAFSKVLAEEKSKFLLQYQQLNSRYASLQRERLDNTIEYETYQIQLSKINKALLTYLKFENTPILKTPLLFNLRLYWTFILPVILSVFLIGFGLNREDSPDSFPQAFKGKISGLISELPISDAQVVLVKKQGATSESTKTDSEGIFYFQTDLELNTGTIIQVFPKNCDSAKYEFQLKKLRKIQNKESNLPSYELKTPC